MMRPGGEPGGDPFEPGVERVLPLIGPERRIFSSYHVTQSAKTKPLPEVRENPFAELPPEEQHAARLDILRAHQADEDIDPDARPWLTQTLGREKALAARWKERGRRLAQTKGYERGKEQEGRLERVEEFRILVKKAQAARDGLRYLKPPVIEIPEIPDDATQAEREQLEKDRARLIAERDQLRQQYADERLDFLTKSLVYKARIRERLADPEDGPKLEQAWREYLKGRRQYIAWAELEVELNQLDAALLRGSRVVLPGMTEAREQGKAPSPRLLRRHASIALVSREHKLAEAQQAVLREREALVRELSLACDPGSETYAETLAAIERAVATSTPPPAAETRGPQGASLEQSAQRRIQIIEDRRQREWRDNAAIQYFEVQRQIEERQADLNRDAEVLCFPSVTAHTNWLHDIRMKHHRTTVGGALVGPPGVGKTTLIHYYLRLIGQEAETIDMSKEVTRFQLFGSKEIQTRSPHLAQAEFLQALEGLEADQIAHMIRENAHHFQEGFELRPHEAQAMAILKLIEAADAPFETGATLPQDLLRAAADAKEQILEFARREYRQALADTFAHALKRNGWRDGIIVACLRAKRSVVMDEFNKGTVSSALHSLLTTHPGALWSFADNVERIRVPENFRLFFTANIGKRHGVFTIQEALGTRLQGKIARVPFPPKAEELALMVLGLADTTGEGLVSLTTLRRAQALIQEVWPAVREKVLTKHDLTYSLSFRTIRDIIEKMVWRSEAFGYPRTTLTGSTFAKAVFEVMVQPYDAYEDKTAAGETTMLLSTHGIFVEDEWVKQECVSRGYITAEKWAENETKILEKETKTLKGRGGEPADATTVHRLVKAAFTSAGPTYNEVNVARFTGQSV